MQFPESWLRSFCNPPLTTAELADTLTMAGLEVESVEPVAPPFHHVVVGEIQVAVQHPNADRLRVCTVDVGSGSPLTIVCGAPNARIGIKVPCALVGAELPPGEEGRPFSIKLGKLRGVESQGMLCSGRELGLSEDHGGLLELAADATVGANVRDVLRLDDAVFTLKLTPNLGHALSVYGVARELAALTGAPLQEAAIEPVAPRHAAVLPVRVEAQDLCGRFAGRVIRGIDPTASTPAWMVERLARCGQRSVAPLVDISNYVMFELGRPSHIFDLDKIHGGLVVRWARAGESLMLLNGNTVSLGDDVGVIADDQAVESLAGIMGGDATAVTDGTRNVYIEAAFWWPEAVAGRSRRFQFATDAGHRFERGVDPSTLVPHIERITQLVLDICGGEPGPVDDTVLRLPERRAVTVRVKRAAKVIGMPVDAERCALLLRRLGMDVVVEAGDRLHVTPPAHRFDVRIEEDLIEEIARLIGYDNLPTDAPIAPVAPRPQPEGRRGAYALRRAVAALGYQETINFSFVEARWEAELAGNAEPVRLLNPIAAPLSVMRSSLIGSLLQVLKFNLDRKVPRARLFEVGRVFVRDAAEATGYQSVAGVRQPVRVAGIAYGAADAEQWGTAARKVDFFDAKGDVEALLAPRTVRCVPAAHPAFHPGRCAEVFVDGTSAGFVGELHPRWRQAWGLAHAPVLFELDADVVQQRAVPQFEAVPRFPAVERDIAIVVGPSVGHDALMAAIHGAPTEGLLQGAVLFDVYRPPAGGSGGMADGERSLAVRLTLQSDTATLTEAQIDAAVAAVLQQLATQLQARLRA